MKILVIQLARLGDIYLSWPALSGLRRKYPDSQIDILVREKFASAAIGNIDIDSVIRLPTAHILNSILQEAEVSESFEAIEKFCSSLRDENYNKIINLSFSPFSSYLVSAISGGSLAEVKGYSRYEDGYLSIGDDVSAYFYAQVGIGKPNRVHLAQIFSGVAGVELIDEDWKISELDDSKNNFITKSKDPYLLLQVGASQIEKTYGVDKWAGVLNHLSKLSDIKVVLVGSLSEKKIAADLVGKTSNKNIINIVGQTEVSHLMGLAKNAKLVVGCDSLMVHIASLTRVPTLNVSFDTVNFWETGPLADGSRVIYGKTPNDIASDRVAYEIKCMLEGKESGNPVYLRFNGNLESYIPSGYVDESFCWKFILALYMEKEFPVVDDEITLKGLEKLYATSQLALEQLNHLKNCKPGSYQLKILSFVDDIILQIPNLAPQLHPLVSWFQTERVRIGPASFEDLQLKTKSLFHKFMDIINLCLDNFDLPGVETKEAEIANANVFE